MSDIFSIHQNYLTLLQNRYIFILLSLISTTMVISCFLFVREGGRNGWNSRLTAPYQATDIYYIEIYQISLLYK